jgi:hypothetical protein
VPIAVVMAAAVWPIASRGRSSEPWATGLIAASALAFLIGRGNWLIGAGWMLLALLVAALVWFGPRPKWRRPDAADSAGLVGWAVAIAVRPQLMAPDGGGWLAPLLMLLAVRRLAAMVWIDRRPPSEEPYPPSRPVRGTLSLREAVAAGGDRIPRTVPLDLEVRAGGSLAVLCDAAQDRELLANLFAGRVRPTSGEVAVDEMPLTPDDRLVAVVGLGERFLYGRIEGNVAALCVEPPGRDTVVAVVESCALDEVAEALGEAVIGPDGSPLEPYHRLLLLAARVIPSEYRVVVVVDPMPWVNAVRGERWRSAVVRASVGRTAVWITPDRELARRAGAVLGFRQGALREPRAGAD